MAEATPAHMKAWQQDKPGSLAANLKLVDVPKPSSDGLKDGEILVQVASACINPADYKVPELGLVARAVIAFPKIFGMDLSGTVVATAAGLEDISVGDKVIGRVNPLKRPGSLAEFVVLPRESYGKLAPDADLELAAGVPTTGLTALQCIAPYIKPGDKVFINGGSGGAGTYGIQVGKALGCHVTTSCSSAKVALCESLGADAVIDYKKTDVLTELRSHGEAYTLIVDNVGTSPAALFSHCAAFLKPGGTFVSVGGAASLEQMKGVGSGLLRPTWLGGVDRKYVQFVTSNVHEDLDRLAGWLRDGTVKTVIDEKFGFDGVQEAYEKLKGGRTTGKIIVEVNKRE